MATITDTRMLVLPVGNKNSTSSNGLNKLGSGWMDDSTATKSTVATTESSQSPSPLSSDEETDDHIVMTSTGAPKPNRSLSEPAMLHNRVVDSDFDSDFDSLPDNDDREEEKENTDTIKSVPENNETNNNTVQVLKVDFGTLTIREYPRILGDGVTIKGPPLTIAWKHQDENEYEVDEYEKAMEGNRRLQSELKIPSKDREAMMKASGFSKKEILECSKQATITRNQRKWTVERLGMTPVHEVMEKVKNPFKFGKKRQKKRLQKAISESQKGKMSKRHTM